MPVVSVSLTEQNLEDLDIIQEELGLSSRSEAIRMALRTLAAERDDRRLLSGKVDGVLLIINEERSSNDINEVYHHYRDTVKTHIHNHLGPERCANVFLMRAEAGIVNDLMDRLQGVKGIHYMKFIRS